MRICVTILCITLFLGACSQTDKPILEQRTGVCKLGKEVAGKPSYPHCPTDVKRVLSRAIACQHYGGEIGGDGSARDKEVFAEMKKLRCNHTKKDVRALKNKYASDAGVLTTIKKTYANYAIE